MDIPPDGGIVLGGVEQKTTKKDRIMDFSELIKAYEKEIGKLKNGIITNTDYVKTVIEIYNRYEAKNKKDEL